MSDINRMVSSQISYGLENNDIYVTNIDSPINLEAIGSFLGTIIRPRFSDPLVQTLSPKHQNHANKLSLSGVFGMGRFPYHTDCAHHVSTPKLLLLYCSKSDETNTPTEVLITNPKDLLEINELNKCYKFHSGRKYFNSPLVYRSSRNGKLALRFDPGCMILENNSSNELEATLNMILSRSKKVIINWSKGVLVAINNHACLHSRPPIINRGNRELERVLIL